MIRKKNKKCPCWGIDIESGITSLKIDNCQFQVSDVRKLSFENESFTTIFALDTLEHIENVDSAISEIYRVLQSEGKFVLCGPTESKFYKLGRFFAVGRFSKNDENISDTGSDKKFHFHDIYDVEKVVMENKFRKISQVSLPKFPLPTLFRITLFQKY